MHFILGAKPGDHEFLFDQRIAAFEDDRVTTLSWKVGDGRAEISFVNQVPLNESNPDLLVNFLHYVEYGPDGKERKIFIWVTDLHITRSNARLLVRGVWKKLGSKRALWDHLRSHFRHFTFQSMKHLDEVMLYRLAHNLPAPSLDSS